MRNRRRTHPPAFDAPPQGAAPAYVARLLRQRRWVSGAACVFLALAVIGWIEARSYRADLRAEQAASASQVEAARKVTADLLAEAAQGRHASVWMDVLRADGVRPLAFVPTHGAESGAAWGLGAYDRAARRAVLHFGGLTAAEGLTFEIWAEGEDGPQRLGVLRPEAGGRVMLRLDEVPAEATALAVTLEVARPSGSPPPSAMGTVLLRALLEGGAEGE
jgi:anti-sigma-K factor RskA